MPEGIRLLFCSPLPETAKTSLAAAVTHASYVVRFRGERSAGTVMEKKSVEYIRQEQIICRKLNKKKKEVQTDIRPLILSFSFGEDGGERCRLFHDAADGKLGQSQSRDADPVLSAVSAAWNIYVISGTTGVQRCIFLPQRARQIRPLEEFAG